MVTWQMRETSLRGGCSLAPRFEVLGGINKPGTSPLELSVFLFEVPLEPEGRATFLCHVEDKQLTGLC